MKQCLVLPQSVSFPVSTAFDSLSKISIGQFMTHQRYFKCLDSWLQSCNSLILWTTFLIPQMLSEIICALWALFSTAGREYYALGMATRFHEPTQPTHTTQWLQNHPVEICPAKRRGEFVLLFLWTSKVASPLSGDAGIAMEVQLKILTLTII